jgi:hypothetical protein
MEQRFSVGIDLTNSNLITLPEHLQTHANPKRLAYLRFGINAIETSVLFSRELGPGDILISQNIIEELRISVNMNYK